MLENDPAAGGSPGGRVLFVPGGKSAGSGEHHRCSLGPPVQIVILDNCTLNRHPCRFLGPGAVPGDTPSARKSGGFGIFRLLRGEGTVATIRKTRMPKEVVFLDEKEAREELRFFLKDTVRRSVDFSRTAQNLGAPPPPVQKPVPGGAARITLTGPEEWTAVGDISLREALGNRRSVRKYSHRPFRSKNLPSCSGPPRASGAKRIRFAPTAPSRRRGAGTPSRPTWRSSGSRAWKEDSTATSPWSTPSFPWVIRTVSRRRRSGRPSVRNLPGRER